MKGIALLLLLAGAGCTQHETGPLETGLWGGEGIELTVTASSARVELDCAVGEIPTRINLFDGEFSVDGRLATVAGPVRENEQLQWRSARFSGYVEKAGRMQLTIALLDTPSSSSFYELYHNRAGLTRRCL